MTPTSQEDEYADFLNKVVNEVNTRLREFFRELASEALRESRRVIELADVGADYTLRGGKRLRAVLVATGCWCACGNRELVNKVIDLAAAIELLQSYLLVHDDIMDRDELRRGGPTAHVTFTKKCLEHGWRDCSHYGVSQAITLGDLLEASAVGLITRSPLPSHIVKTLVQTYSSGLRKVAYGQFLDVMLSQLSLAEISEEDVLLVYKLKTSSYTIELPLHLGAIACGGDSELLSTLSLYAIPAGIAFQVRDDIIGLYGSPEVTGKPAGSDVKGKKKTLLVIKAYQLGGVEERKFLEEVYDKLDSQQITDLHVERVREIVKSTGSLDYSEKLIDEHINSALKALESSSTICSEVKEFLKYMTMRLAYREK